MLVVNCSGTPREIGLAHGHQAALQIQRGITYYKRQFVVTSKMEWPAVCELALRFDPQLKERYPWLREELQAVAEGAEVGYAEVLALNFRQEIIFGMYADWRSSDAEPKADLGTEGCTSLAWKTPGGPSYLAQNWDWLVEQKENIIVLNIDAPGKPRISMGTEAGIIGKIGLNSAGVGVCANGIRVRGVDYNGTPVHICRRLVLESSSREEAIAKLEKYGTAASGHMLVGDATGSIGLECTTKGIVRLQPDGKGRVLHTNHLVAKGAPEDVFLPDSPVRLARLQALADGLGDIPTEGAIAKVFQDELNAPGAINRSVDPGDPLGAIETLFNIVMDLGRAEARFQLGRPSEGGEVLLFKP